jgi:hypothetical protein
MVLTEFEQNIISKLETREKNGKKLSKSSIDLYLRNLQKLNELMPIKNLKFLENTENIKTMLENYKPTTRRSYYISIVSVLACFKDVAKYDKLYQEYTKIMLEENKKVNDDSDGTKTDTQNANWVDKSDVDKVVDSLKERVNAIAEKKEIGSGQFNVILDYLILSLYTLIPPRRNLDYSQMWICRNAGTDQEKNYLEVNMKGEPYKMIFNKFKTSKSAGTQEVVVPDELKRIINIYLKFRPDYQDVKKVKEFTIPLLKNGKMERLDKINSITRVLNKLFSPKKVGSSMLRHVYLTEKYGEQLNELETDAEAMGTSTNMAQSTYIKNK